MTPLKHFTQERNYWLNQIEYGCKDVAKAEAKIRFAEAAIKAWSK